MTKWENFEFFHTKTMGDSKTRFSPINCTESEVSAEKKLLPCRVRTRQFVSLNIVNFPYGYFHVISHSNFRRNFPCFLTHPTCIRLAQKSYFYFYRVPQYVCPASIENGAFFYIFRFYTIFSRYFAFLPLTVLNSTLESPF